MKIKVLLFLLAFISLQVFSQIPQKGLVGYWPFNGNANDNSGRGNNGVNHGASLTTDRFDNENNAFLFNGVNNYIFITASDSINFNSGSGYSFSIWVNIQDTLYLKDFMDIRSDLTNMSFDHTIRNDSVGFVVFNGKSSDVRIISTKRLSKDQWYHLAGTIDFASNHTIIYIDDHIIGESLNNVSIPYAPKINIGSRYDTYGTRNFYFKGKLDDLRLYNRALSKDEVKSLYLENTCLREITDTLFVLDTVKIINTIQDTIRIMDTIKVMDTIKINDTIRILDTMFISIEIKDTIRISVTDTLVINSNLIDTNPIMHEASLKIYPNPSKEFINVDCGANFDFYRGFKIKLVNSNGQEIYSSEINSSILHISLNELNLKKGIIHLILINKENNSIEDRKIVIK